MTGFLRVAIVGCGIIGHTHADAILLHPRLRVAALVDPVLPASETLAAHIATGSEPPARYPTLAGALAGTVHPHGISMSGRWVGLSYDGKIMTGWGGMGQSEDNARELIEQLKEHPA